MISTAKNLIKFSVAKFKLEPSLFIAGFQKCGTTSLYNYLLTTKIYVPGKIKENNYLPKSAVFHKYIYSCSFPWKRPGKKTLDASHLNTYYPYSLQRIKVHFPNAQVIFIMRNPVDRAYSHYQHNIRNGRDTLSFSERLEEEFKIINQINNLSNIKEVFQKTVGFEVYGLPITKGIYVNYLQIAQELGLDFLPVCLENLEADFDGCWKRITDFLDIDVNVIPKRSVYNRAPPYSEMRFRDRKRLEEFYKAYNEQLFSLIGERYPW